MRIKERIKRYFRREVENHMTLVRYSSKNMRTVFFFELAPKSGYGFSIELRLFQDLNGTQVTNKRAMSDLR